MQSEFAKKNKKVLPRGAVRLFTPGHKGSISWFDLTEIPGADDLRAPTGIIKEAQARAAEVFGAENTHFLVGGSTLGNQAMIVSAVLQRRGALLVNKHCHASVVNTCKLLNITPIFLDEPILPYWNIPDAITPEMIEEALNKHSEVTAVLITSPTYYGICSDIEQISRVCHLKGVPLLIDQAHGAHLAFSDKLPPDAMQAGADLCVQSAHKTLPSLTQTAFAHRRKDSLISSEIFQEALNLFQTTSPSYLFMLSLAESVEIMAKNGAKRLEWLIGKCEEFKSKVECLNTSDITRIVFKGDAEKLRRMGVWVEMADEFGNVVCIPTICNTNKDFVKLLKGAH